jgi:1-acyl-sn-glycerol-3-phosphate acyltransferase
LTGRLKGSFWNIWLVISLLATNFFQMLSLVVFPFSGHIFRKANRFFANAWWTFFIYVVEKKNRVKVTFWGERVPDRESVIIISNHQCMSDIPAVMALAVRKYRIGDLKFFVKDMIKYVPGVGWGMLFLDCFFVKRNWLSDQESITKTFSNIKKFNVPIWLVSFLEGTRLTPTKLKASQTYAEKSQLWRPEHVLLPRTKGFVATVQGLRDHVHAIYDLTIGYPNGIPSLSQLLMGYVPSLHIHVRRTPVGDLPTDPAKLTQWVFDQFKRKNQMMAHFHRHGLFEGNPLTEL